MNELTSSSQIWALLYAQVTQVDGSGQRNILLARARANITDLQYRGRSGKVFGFAIWDQADIAARLAQLGLPAESGLSVLAVELLPEPSMIFKDPLGSTEHRLAEQAKALSDWTGKLSAASQGWQ